MSARSTISARKCASYLEGWRSYWNAINEIFHDEDPGIEQAVEQLHDAQDSLQRMTQHLANIAQVINAITTAVKIVTQLASIADNAATFWF